MVDEASSSLANSEAGPESSAFAFALLAWSNSRMLISTNLCNHCPSDCGGRPGAAFSEVFDIDIECIDGGRGVGPPPSPSPKRGSPPFLSVAGLVRGVTTSICWSPCSGSTNLAGVLGVVGLLDGSKSANENGFKQSFSQSNDIQSIAPALRVGQASLSGVSLTLPLVESSKRSELPIRQGQRIGPVFLYVYFLPVYRRRDEMYDQVSQPRGS